MKFRNQLVDAADLLPGSVLPELVIGGLLSLDGTGALVTSLAKPRIVFDGGVPYTGSFRFETGADQESQPAHIEAFTEQLAPGWPEYPVLRVRAGRTPANSGPQVEFGHAPGSGTRPNAMYVSGGVGDDLGVSMATGIDLQEADPTEPVRVHSWVESAGRTVALSLPAPLTLPNGAIWLVFGPGSETRDDWGGHSTVVNTDRVVVPDDGVYLMTAHAIISQSAAGSFRHLTLYSSVAGYHAQQLSPPLGAYPDRLSVASVWPLVAGEYVRATIAHNAGVNLSATTGVLTVTRLV